MTLAAAALATTAVGSAGCPSVTLRRDEAAAGGRESCDVRPLDLSASAAHGIAPNAASRDGRLAVAWLELGEQQRVHLAVGRSDGTPRLDGPPRDVAPGWSGLGAPLVAEVDDGFLVAFSARAPDGRQGIATARLHAAEAAATLDPPSLALVAKGARLGGFATAGARVYGGWWSWDAPVRVVTVSRLDGLGAQRPPVVLGPASVAPAIDLVGDGDRVWAVWLGLEGAAVEARERVWVARLDSGGQLEGKPAALDEGVSPSLALLPAGPIVEYEGVMDGVTWVGRPGTVGQRIDGRLGDITTAKDGAVLCYTRRTVAATGEVRCMRFDASGKRRGDFGVAAGVAGVRGINVSVDDRRILVAWQADEPSGDSRVAASVATCSD